MKGEYSTNIMDDFWSSLSKWFNERTGSPLYFTYLGFLIAWNWQFFQIIFLESSSLFLVPRIEYISSNLLFHFEITLLPWWVNLIVINIANLFWHLAPPAFLTWIAIEFLPQIQRWALKKYLASRLERKKMVFEDDKEYNEWRLESERSREETLNKIAKVKKRQVATVKEIEKDSSKLKEEWEKDYQKFAKSSLFSKFHQLTWVVYSNGGGTFKWDGDRGDFDRTLIPAIDTDIFGFADSNGLIIKRSGILNNKDEERIELTDKGKFFVSKYLMNEKDMDTPSPYNTLI